MKKLLILLSLAILLVSGCETLDTVETTETGENTTPESTDTPSQPQDNIEIKNIKNINLGDATNLNLSQNEVEKLEISAPEDLLPKIKGIVKEDTITLGVNDAITRSHEITFTLQVKDLSTLNVSGASKATVDTFNTTDLSINISGASTLNFTSLNGNLLTLDTNGASTANISGTVTDQNATISGGSTYSAQDLESNNVVIDESGASNATVWAKEILDATLSGASNLKYKGSPKISQNLSGDSEITQLN